MQSLYENMVLEWYVADEEDHYIERILWISPTRDIVFSIAMHNDKAFPIMKTYS